MHKAAVSLLIFITIWGKADGVADIYIGALLKQTYDKDLIQMAIDDVNNNTSLLPGMRLNAKFLEYNWRKPTARSSLNSFIQESPTKLLLFAVDTGMKGATDVASSWNLLAVGFDYSASGFYDPEVDRLSPEKQFVQITPAAFTYGHCALEFVRRFRWKQVSMLSWKSLKDQSVSSYTKELFQSHNISVLKYDILSSDLTYQLKGFKESDARIIFVFASPTRYLELLCVAHNMGMKTRKYVWISVSVDKSYNMKVFYETDGIQNKSCDTGNFTLGTAADGAFAIEPNFLVQNENISFIARTPQSLVDWCKQNNFSRTPSFSGYTYDAVLLAALLLNNSKLPGNAENWWNVTYENDIQKQLRKELNSVLFEGVTGQVRFSNGYRSTYLAVHQYHGGVNLVASFDTNTKEINWTGEPYWSGNKVPSDSIETRVEIVAVPMVALCVIGAVSAVGICLAFTFLIFNIWKRNERLIKMSSPRLNNVMISGCILTYTGAVLLGCDANIVTTDTLLYICQARIWIMSLGFSLAFGSMFSKTWRVHVILTNKKMEKKVIKDTQLFILVGAIILFDVVYLMTWSLMQPLNIVTKDLPSKVNVEVDIRVIPRAVICQSDNFNLWLTGIYMFKGLLLFFGIFLAWETRKVVIPALNDSKNIGICVYNVFIVSIIGGPLSMMLDESFRTMLYILVSTGIVLVTSATLLIIFLPKVLGIYHGVEVSTSTVQPGASSLATNMTRTTSRGCRGFCDEARKLRTMYNDAKKEIEGLKRQLNKDGCTENNKDAVPRDATSVTVG